MVGHRLPIPEVCVFSPKDVCVCVRNLVHSGMILGGWSPGSTAPRKGTALAVQNP